MELIKAIIALITSFFQNKTAVTKKEVTLAEATEAATVETIRANQNSAAIQQEEIIKTKLENLKAKQEKETKKESKKSIDTQFDNQFGSDE